MTKPFVANQYSPKDYWKIKNAVENISRTQMQINGVWANPLRDLAEQISLETPESFMTNIGKYLPKIIEMPNMRRNLLENPEGNVAIQAFLAKTPNWEPWAEKILFSDTVPGSKEGNKRFDKIIGSNTDKITSKALIDSVDNTTTRPYHRNMDRASLRGIVNNPNIPEAVRAQWTPEAILKTHSDSINNTLYTPAENVERAHGQQFITTPMAAYMMEAAPNPLAATLSLGAGTAANGGFGDIFRFPHDYDWSNERNPEVLHHLKQFLDVDYPNRQVNAVNRHEGVMQKDQIKSLMKAPNVGYEDFRQHSFAEMADMLDFNTLPDEYVQKLVDDAANDHPHLKNITDPSTLHALMRNADKSSLGKDAALRNIILNVTKLNKDQWSNQRAYGALSEMAVSANSKVTNPDFLNTLKSLVVDPSLPKEVHDRVVHTASQLALNSNQGTDLANAIASTPGYKGMLVLHPEYRKNMTDAEVAESLPMLEKRSIAMYPDGIDTVHNAFQSIRKERPNVHPQMADAIFNQDSTVDMKAHDLWKIGWYPQSKDDWKKALQDRSTLPAILMSEVPMEDRPESKKALHELMTDPTDQSVSINQVKKDYIENIRGNSYDGFEPSKQERHEVWKSLPEEAKKGSVEHLHPDTMEHPLTADDATKYLLDHQKTPDNYHIAQTILALPGGKELFKQKVMSTDKKDKAWKAFVMALKPENLSTIFKPSDIKQMVEDQTKNPRSGYKKLLTALKANTRSAISGIDSVKLNYTEKLRAARDLLEARGGSAHYKQLEQSGLNPKALGIEHLRDPKNQHISADAVQEVIDKSPTQEYGVGHSLWTSPLQNHNPKVKNHVFQLKITPEMRKKLKDEGVEEYFDKLFESSYRSGHPVDKDTLGWIRYSMGPDGVFIDEAQSDLGQSTLRKLAAMEKTGVDEEDIEELRQQQGDNVANQARAAAQQQFADGSLQRDARRLRHGVETTMNVAFGDKHPSEVLMHAFHQTMRDAGLADTPIHMWQAEPKSVESNQSQEVHRYSHDELQKYGDPEKTWTTGKAAKAHKHLKSIGAVGNPQKISEFFEKNKDVDHLVPIKDPLPNHMRETYGDIPKSMGYKPDTYGGLSVESKRHQGKPVWSQRLKKSEESLTYLLGRVSALCEGSDENL